jgi:hypothetical protein
MSKKLKEFTNPELLQELAKRIVSGQLKLDKPKDWIIEGETPEKIVKNLKEKMGLFNQDGYALSNISDIYDKETNSDPLNLNYFIAEEKNKKHELT